jgi:hypothetical protein
LKPVPSQYSSLKNRGKGRSKVEERLLAFETLDYDSVVNV